MKKKAFYNPNWGGKRKGSGRKPRREDLVRVETLIEPELKEKVKAIANENYFTVRKYLEILIKRDIRQREEMKKEEEKD